MARSRRSGGGAVGEGETRPVSPAEPSFETSLAELEGVVARLESGEMPLEEALEAFESGVKLSRRCAATLDAAERRIEILMAERAGTGLRVEPFGGVATEAADDEDESGAADDEPDDDERER